MWEDEAYDPGDPKRSDYTPPPACVFCGCLGGHYTGCQVVPR